MPIAQAEIALSNNAAMANTAQYPLYEKKFLLKCCDWVKRNCPSDCRCREFSVLDEQSDMCWVIKEDCSLQDFKELFNKLWVGSNFQQRFLNNASHQRINRALTIFSEITSKNWKDICKIGNSNRRCIICSEPLLNSAIKLRNKYNTDSIYDSKFLSQVFYDTLIPHDTNSKKAMKDVGYEPSQNGLDMGKHIIDFLRKNKINITEFRNIDDAPNSCWGMPVIGANPPQALSRVIDKLFYVP